MDIFNMLVKAKTFNQSSVKKIAAHGAPLLSPSWMMGRDYLPAQSWPLILFVSSPLDTIILSHLV